MNTVKNITPKRKFGQNFLVDEGILESIRLDITTLISQYHHVTQVIEVGPGMGALTQILDSLPIDSTHTQDNANTENELQAIPSLHIDALEIDEEAYNQLITVPWKKTSIHLIDALEMFEGGIDCALWNTYQLPNSFHLISNLPFNVGSRILVELGITSPSSPFYVILQDEVSRKTQLHNLERSPTLFGYWMNLFWDMKIVRKVPPNAFSPQPRVMCSILQGSPKLEITNSTLYMHRDQTLKLLKALTAHPRKTIHKNISLSQNRTYIKALQALKIDPSLRLTVHNYRSILIDLMVFITQA